MRRLGLLGGTFDPPHAAHLAMARAALANDLVDEVVVIPAGDPWQKPGRTPKQHRLAMTRLAFANEPSCVVSDAEANREGPTYTIDTVQAMQSPHLQLHSIIGSDTLALLPTWHRIDELVHLCTFLVVRRPGALVTPPDIPGLHCEVVEAREWPTASSELRSEIARTHTRPHEVDARVWDYIVEHGLYGTAHA